MVSCYFCRKRRDERSHREKPADDARHVIQCVDLRNRISAHQIRAHFTRRFVDVYDVSTITRFAIAKKEKAKVRANLLHIEAPESVVSVTDQDESAAADEEADEKAAGEQPEEPQKQGDSWRGRPAICVRSSTRLVRSSSF